jgi:hypothetical protein
MPHIYSLINLSLQITTSYRNENLYKHGPGMYGNFEVFDDIQLFFSNSIMELLKQNKFGGL